MELRFLYNRNQLADESNRSCSTYLYLRVNTKITILVSLQFDLLGGNVDLEELTLITKDLQPV